MASGRKRRLTAEEEKNLHTCLAVPNASENVVLQVWNIASRLRVDEKEPHISTLKSVAAKRLLAAKTCYEEWQVPDTNTQVWMPRVDKILQFMLEDKEWLGAFTQAVQADHGLLHPILYHDDVTCGNILAVLKKKKITAMYLSFRQMFPHVASEAAWLPLLVMQRSQQDEIPGGLSAVLVELVARVATQTTEGFDLDLPEGSKRCRLSTPFLFLSDLEAQRATWCVKGSSGLKPCMFCSNIVSKHALSTEHEAFHTISSHEWSKFQSITDADFALAVSHLKACETKSERDQWEKAYGVTLIDGSLLTSEVAMQILPPSGACNDVLHNYFANGVASVEVLAIVNLLADAGMPLKSLRDLAAEQAWRRHAKSTPATSRYVRFLLADKMFEGRVYKGDGNETQPLVFLLRYILEEHTADTLIHAQHLESFAVLHACVRELRALKNWPGKLRDETDVARLRALQLEHQKKFVEAYTDDLVIPKHHHRLHVPDSALKLGFLPLCDVHESKHRVLKSGGLMDNQKGKINEHSNLQYQVVSRVLETTRDLSQKHGLTKWEITTCLKLAPVNLQRLFGDNSLATGKSMQLRQQILREEEPVFLADRAYVVKRCLQGNKAGLWLELLPLQLKDLFPWGSLWQCSHVAHEFCKPKAHHKIMLPVWWKCEDAVFTFLY